jgi:uncharacterized protein YkwD
MFYTRKKRISKLFFASLAIFLFFPFISFSLTKKASNDISNEELSLLVHNQSISEYSLSYFTNKQRTEHGLLALKNNFALQKAAQSKAEDMAKKEYFSHLSPEGRTPWYWIEKSSYNYSSAGENLAVKFSDPETLVSRWMASQAHRENILNSNFEDFGIGIAKGNYNGRKALYVVEMYGQAKKNISSFSSIH